MSLLSISYPSFLFTKLLAGLNNAKEEGREEGIEQKTREAAQNMRSKGLEEIHHETGWDI